jgi:hypothetical protein
MRADVLSGASQRVLMVFATKTQLLSDIIENCCSWPIEDEPFCKIAASMMRPFHRSVTSDYVTFVGQNTLE